MAVERAPGRPFDNGRFELIEEPIDAPDVVLPKEQLVRIRRPERSVG